MSRVNSYLFPGSVAVPSVAGSGGGQCGVPGTQPHDQTVSLPPGHPHVRLHLLLLVAGQQPGGEGREAGRGPGLPPAS